MPLKTFFDRLLAIVRLQCQRTPISLIRAPIAFALMTLVVSVAVGSTVIGLDFHLNHGDISIEYHGSEENESEHTVADMFFSEVLLLSLYTAIMVLVAIFTITPRATYAFGYDELRDHDNLLFWMPIGPWAAIVGQILICFIYPIVMYALQFVWLALAVFTSASLQLWMFGSHLSDDAWIRMAMERFELWEYIKTILSSAWTLLVQVWPTVAISMMVSHFGRKSTSYIGRLWGGAALVMVVGTFISLLFDDGSAMDWIGLMVVSLVANILLPVEVAEALVAENFVWHPVMQTLRYVVITVAVPVVIAWRMGWRPPTLRKSQNAGV